MAKLTLTLEDGFKDGKPIVKGGFDASDLPQPVNGLPTKTTPAQQYMETVRRLWEHGVIDGLVRLVIPDVLYKNHMIEQQEKQRAIPAATIVQAAEEIPAEEPAAADTAIGGEATPGA